MNGASVLLALGSAVFYGAGDFLGGQGTRRSNPLRMSVVVQVVGLLIAAVAVAAVDRTVPSAAVLAWGALGGVGVGVGNLSLYRGLATGAMNVVAPVSAVLAAAIPAVIGVATGDRLSSAGYVGLMLALPAIAMTCLSSASTLAFFASEARAGVGWALLAGGGFGVLFVAFDRAGTSSGPWPLLPCQLVAVAVTLAAPLRRRRTDADPDPGPGPGTGPGAATTMPWRTPILWGTVSSLSGTGADLLYLFATGHGQLTTVAVITSLYPAVTVVLAAVILHERTSRVQLAGLTAAVAAVVLMTSGG